MAHNAQIYPIFGVEAVDKDETGIVAGKDKSETTKKRIWTQAEERAIEDTPANRRLAYRIDGLVRFITNIKRFSILKDYTISSDDDTANEQLLIDVEKFVRDIKLLRAFREVFQPLQIEGAGHLQKQYDGASVSSLAILENLTKHTNPTKVNDFYYYQNQEVSKNWQNPEETETEALRVWFIDEALRNEYTSIKEGKDKVYSRDRIIEIRNNEAGESNLQTVVSYVFIKNYLLQLMPNLIEIVTSPHEQIIYSTVDKAGVPCIPKMPAPSLKAIDPIKYSDEVAEYTAWTANLKTLANRIALDRDRQRKTIHPDTIEEKILESEASLNSDMIKALIHSLDVQIAYGMGFSLSLVEASGTEKASARNIYSTISVTMSGVQGQFNAIADELIYEQFSGAEAAGVKFKLEDLNPEDKLSVAERKKKYAEIADILYNMQVEPTSIANFIGQNIDENLELLAGEPLPEAEKAIEAMLDYRTMHLNDEEEDLEED